MFLLVEGEEGHYDSTTCSADSSVDSDLAQSIDSLACHNGKLSTDQFLVSFWK